LAEPDRLARLKGVAVTGTKSGLLVKSISVLFLMAALLSGCTVIKINGDDTTTIEHKAGVGVAQDLANRSCRRAGKQSAVLISTVNKDVTLPQQSGRQVTTFRCS
jgi:hypothetical protein